MTRVTTRSCEGFASSRFGPDVARRAGVGQRVARAAVRGEDRLAVRRLLCRDAGARDCTRRTSRCPGPPDPGRRRRIPARRRRTAEASVEPGIPGAAVEGLDDREQDLLATTCVNVSDVIPASRDWAKASSRLGPIVPFVPASARVWQPPHAWRKSFLPAPWLPSLEYPPVPHPTARVRVPRARHCDEYDGPHEAESTASRCPGRTVTRGRCR